MNAAACPARQVRHLEARGVVLGEVAVGLVGLADLGPGQVARRSARRRRDERGDEELGLDGHPVDVARCATSGSASPGSVELDRLGLAAGPDERAGLLGLALGVGLGERERAVPDHVVAAALASTSVPGVSTRKSTSYESWLEPVDEPERARADRGLERGASAVALLDAQRVAGERAARPRPGVNDSVRVSTVLAPRRQTRRSRARRPRPRPARRARRSWRVS